MHFSVVLLAFQWEATQILHFRFSAFSAGGGGEASFTIKGGLARRFLRNHCECRYQTWTTGSLVDCIDKSSRQDHGKEPVRRND